MTNEQYAQKYLELSQKNAVLSREHGQFVSIRMLPDASIEVVAQPYGPYERSQKYTITSTGDEWDFDTALHLVAEVQKFKDGEKAMWNGMREIVKNRTDDELKVLLQFFRGTAECPPSRRERTLAESVLAEQVRRKT